MLQAGPFKPGTPQLAGPVSICWRHSDGSRRGAQGAYARFEKMSRESFMSLSVLTSSGWVVQVGNSTLEKCKAAIGKLMPKLPR
jgi:hypothetical protein